jgi:hypothetical protein
MALVVVAPAMQRNAAERAPRMPVSRADTRWMSFLA